MNFVSIYNLGEIAFLVGLFLQYYALLTPTPWRGTMTDSTIYFAPYVRPQGSCGSANASNATVHGVRTIRIDMKREGDGSELEAPKVGPGVSLGPLGSCSWDEDGRIFCTKPSFFHPQYNFTHLEVNTVSPPPTLPTVSRGTRGAMLALVIINSMSFMAYLIHSLPYWFPAKYRRLLGTTPTSRLEYKLVAIGLAVSGFVQIFINVWISVPEVNSFNDLIEKMDLPAQCGTVRELQPGFLWKAFEGDASTYILAGWGLMFIYACAGLVFRGLSYLGDDFAKHADEAEITASRKKKLKAAKARAKEERKSRKKVEREKTWLVKLHAWDKAQGNEDSEDDTSSLYSYKTEAV